MVTAEMDSVPVKARVMTVRDCRNEGVGVPRYWPNEDGKPVDVYVITDVK